MKNSWTKTFRRLAAASAVAGSTAFWSAMCHAQSAMDSASDPVYADGWQAGDNGGTGFTPWNFDSTYYVNGIHFAYTNTGYKAIDDGQQAGTQFSNPFNAIGRAWTMGELPRDAKPGAGRAGRGFAPLQIGQTLKVEIDNPPEAPFFKGLFIRLNGGTGGVNGNICAKADHPCTPGGTALTKMRFQAFEYAPPDQTWDIIDAGAALNALSKADTAANGAVFAVTRTGADSYDVRMDSNGGGPSFFAAGRTFEHPGVDVDWIEFTFFNAIQSDTGLPPTVATDLYIRSIMIVPEPGAAMLLLLGVGGTLLGRARLRRHV
jgi:hypothetical protein